MEVERKGLFLKTLQKYIQRPYMAGIFLVCFVPGLTGCASFATKQIPIDRAGFADAISSSDDELLLMNIVRLHFEDRPAFVSVQAITTSNSVSLGASANGDYSNIPSTTQSVDYGILEGTFLQLIGRNISKTFSRSASLGVSPNVSYTQAPTISYAPLQGERFTRQMLQPVSLRTLYGMLRAGWRPEKIMRLMVDKIGDIENLAYARKNAIPDNRKFVEVVKYLKELHDRNMIYFDLGQVTSAGDADSPPRQVPVVAKQEGEASTPEAATPEAAVQTAPSLDLYILKKYRNAPEIQKMFKMLKLKHSADVIHFVDNPSFAMINADHNVKEIRPRSFLNLIGYLSNSVETPPELIRSGIVFAPRYPNGKYFDLTLVTQGILRVHVSPTRPKGNINVMVHYRNHWFYIADNDVQSKKTIALVEQLFNLQAGDIRDQNTPILTIPVR